MDYHFELSADPRMRWPLSSNFEKLVSLTPSRGQARWTALGAGLLNPDTTYYWRVRALDASGVWGPWSRTFRFRIQAPGVPLDVALAPDQEGGFTLVWRANPRGCQPAAYKVYGSDGKGFSVSDDEHLVFRGKGFVATMEEYDRKPADAPDAGLVRTPGNLIGQVRDARLNVVGRKATLPNCNRAFYRVAAVDSAGHESCPSDYAGGAAAVRLQPPYFAGQSRRLLPLSTRRHPLAGRPASPPPARAPPITRLSGIAKRSRSRRSACPPASRWTLKPD